MISFSNVARLASTAAIVALALAAFSNVASAQPTSAQQNALRANCRSDFMSKCSGVTPGGKDAIACLQKNVASLAPGCQTAVRATMPAPAAAAPPPAAPPPTAPPPAAAAPSPTAPARATIKTAPPPRATLHSTTSKPKPPAKPQAPKQAVVTPPAAAPVAAAPAPTPEQLKAITFTCRRDFKALCRGVPAGGADALACLQRSAKRLSSNCKTSLAAIADKTPIVPTAAVVPPPPAAHPPKAPIVMTAVIGRACLRDLIRHCRNVKVGDGQKLACLTAHADRLTVPCRAAMKITTPLR